MHPRAVARLLSARLRDTQSNRSGPVTPVRSVPQCAAAGVCAVCNSLPYDVCVRRTAACILQDGRELPWPLKGRGSIDRETVVTSGGREAKRVHRPDRSSKLWRHVGCCIVGVERFVRSRSPVRLNNPIRRARFKFAAAASPSQPSADNWIGRIRLPQLTRCRVYEIVRWRCYGQLIHLALPAAPHS